MNKKLCTQSNKLFGLVTVALNFYFASSEAVIDWFGKRGISWYIAVTVYKKGEQIETVTYVHLYSTEKT